ncbi:hypothetical protein [Mariprofundus ferrinatatus]|uniref:hypothetical protein n=1 Tax=Mariprofundus ferrinatatus TaxID=1921087 RepID=UPI0012FEB8C9|nr:hypothetical protein [Mariprofundus ferrinatatus]
MIFKATLDRGRKLLTIKSNCVLGADRFDAIRASIMLHLEGTEGWALVIDHSESFPDKLDYRQVNALTEKSKVFDSLMLRNFIVVVHPKHYGFGRMWEIMASNKMRCNTRAFKSIEEAALFLENS